MYVVWCFTPNIDVLATIYGANLRLVMKIYVFSSSYDDFYDDLQQIRKHTKKYEYEFEILGVRSYFFELDPPPIFYEGNSRILHLELSGHSV